MQDSLAHPPQFTSTLRVSRRARYGTAANALTNKNLTRAMLLNHLVMNISSSTSNYRLLSGIKLNRLEIWSPGDSSFGVTTCSVEWTSTYGPSKIVSDSSMTVNAAHVVAVPPPQSLASFWSLTGFNESDVIAIVNCPANSIIDVSYEAIFQNGETPVLVTTSQSGTVGAVYMEWLFNSSTDARPVSYNAIY